MSQPDPLDRQILEADWTAEQEHLSEWERERWQREALGLRLSKSMMLRQFAVDLDRLPVDIDVTPPAALERFFRGIAIVFLVLTGIPLIILVGLNEPDAPLWGYPAMAFMPVVCIATMVFCTRRIWRQRHVRFETEGVRVRQHRFGGVSEWHAPYDAFTGLLLKRKTIDTRYAERTFQVILLVHPDPRKSVPLLITTNAGKANDRLNQYSARLQLPILESADEEN